MEPESTILKTLSGPIVTFSDAVPNVPVKNLTVNIVPVQEGEGDPSPENVRPIAGWNGVTVTQTGKNLFDGSKVTTAIPNNWGVSFEDGVLTIEHKNAYSTGTPTLVLNLPAGRYSIAYQADRASSVALYVDGSFNKIFSQNSTAFEIANDGKVYDLRFLADANTTNRISRIQVEPGETVTDYEAYQESARSITFPAGAGTVYGGTLDVTTGTLVVDRFYLSLDGSEKWSFINVNGAERYTLALTKSITKLKIIPISSHFKHIISNTGTFGSFRINVQNSGILQINDAGNAQFGGSIIQFNEWLSEQAEGGSPVQVLYAPDTPITYQLTPEQVRTLLGTNNIWADAGDVEVTYLARSSG